MFYLGSHVGPEDDGYVGSSLRMRRAIKKRPEDFRRRIIQRIYDGGQIEVRKAEQRWLQLIKSEELNVRYYNLKRVAFGGDLYKDLTKDRLEATRKKLSASRTGHKHHAARAVIIDGQRFSTITGARKHFGCQIGKRLNSKWLRWRGWYFEDQGPTPLEECLSFEREHKAKQLLHLKALGKVHATRGPEWHAERVRRASNTRHGKPNRKKTNDYSANDGRQRKPAGHQAANVQVAVPTHNSF
jgi:hypothetical protein